MIEDCSPGQPEFWEGLPGWPGLTTVSMETLKNIWLHKGLPAAVIQPGVKKKTRGRVEGTYSLDHNILFAKRKIRLCGKMSIGLKFHVTHV